jgi:HSP20 family protein
MPRATEIEALRRRLSGRFGPSGFEPPVDVYTAGPAGSEAVHVRMEIGGLDLDSVHVDLDGRLLVIAGQRPPGHRGRVTYHHMEIDYGPFQRRLELPADVDAAAATASYAAGYLTVSLPLVQRPRAPQVVVVRVMR